MEDDKKIEVTEVAGKTRRAFVKTAAQVAVTAPAVAMLLSASTKKSEAAILYSLGDDGSVGDDGVVGGSPGDDVVLGDDSIIFP